MSTRPPPMGPAERRAALAALRARRAYVAPRPAAPQPERGLVRFHQAPGRPPEPAPPSAPAIAAALSLGRLIDATPGLLGDWRAGRPVLVDVADRVLLDALKAAWREPFGIGRGAGAQSGDSADDESTEPRGVAAVLYHQAEVSRSRDLAEAEAKFVRRLAWGEPVLGLSPSAQSHLPGLLVRVARPPPRPAADRRRHARPHHRPRDGARLRAGPAGADPLSRRRRGARGNPHRAHAAGLRRGSRAGAGRSGPRPQPRHRARRPPWPRSRGGLGPRRVGRSRGLAAGRDRLGPGRPWRGPRRPARNRQNPLRTGPRRGGRPASHRRVSGQVAEQGTSRRSVEGDERGLCEGPRGVAQHSVHRRDRRLRRPVDVHVRPPGLQRPRS